MRDPQGGPQEAAPGVSEVPAPRDASADHAAADDHAAAADKAAALAHRANADHAGSRIEAPLPDHTAHHTGRADHEADIRLAAHDRSEADTRGRANDDPGVAAVATALIEAVAALEILTAIDALAALLPLKALAGLVPLGAGAALLAGGGGGLPAALLRNEVVAGAARANVLRRSRAAEREESEDAQTSQECLHLISPDEPDIPRVSSLR